MRAVFSARLLLRCEQKSLADRLERPTMRGFAWTLLTTTTTSCDLSAHAALTSRRTITKLSTVVYRPTGAATLAVECSACCLQTASYAAAKVFTSRWPARSKLMQVMCCAAAAGTRRYVMKTSRSQSRGFEPDGFVVVKSDDGIVSYSLQPTRYGLCVQRERRHALGRARFVHTAVFQDCARFLQWCDADSVRFDYPIVLSAIRRQGSAMLESHERMARPDAKHDGR